MQEAGIPDSREEAIEYLNQITFGQSTPELIETYVDNVNPMIEFLRGEGLDFSLSQTFNDYYPTFSGGKPEGRQLSPVSNIEGVRGGGALLRMLQKAAEARGVEFVVGTAAKHFILSPEGEVIGVAAEQNGAPFNVRALRGVVVATGGFDHNDEMVRHFLRGPVYYSSAVKTNTGDGHLMGMALGANLRNMNEHWGWPVFYSEAGGYAMPALAMEIGKPGAIVVNHKGHRFFDESGSYDEVTRAFFNWDTGLHQYENIPAFLIADSGFASRYTLGYMPIPAELPDWIVKADSLGELAAALGIDPAGLEATVSRFNEYAAQGLDPDWQRGVSPFDQLTGGDRTRTDIVSPNLAPLTEAPFYACKVWPGALGTCGGLQINTSAQVLDVWGNPIPRLYAVGNASGSVMGAGYPGGGGTLGSGMTFGFLAADHLNTLASL
jgi:succinate dehydrogenase/fumarate reductase flavoprotein subunit